MPSLRFLVDMNLSPRIVNDLRQQGWDILRVSQVLPMDAEDSEILDFARQQNRVIITRKLLEFLPHIEDRLAEGCAVTIDDRRARIRYLPIS